MHWWCKINKSTLMIALPLLFFSILFIFPTNANATDATTGEDVKVTISLDVASFRDFYSKTFGPNDIQLFSTIKWYGTDDDKKITASDVLLEKTDLNTKLFPRGKKLMSEATSDNTTILASESPKTISFTATFKGVTNRVTSDNYKTIKESFHICLKHSTTICSGNFTKKVGTPQNYTWKLKTTDQSSFLTASPLSNTSSKDEVLTNKDVQINVIVKIPAFTGNNKTLDPISININSYKKNTSTSSSVGSASTKTSSPIIQSSKEQTITLIAIAKEVPATTSENSLKACIGDVCSKEFTKSDNSFAVATIEITEDQYNAAMNGADNTDTKTSCAIGGVGWIVCPVSNFLANIADGAFHYLSGSFLEVKSQAFDTSNTTYDAWSAMRNIANVLFVIVFLAIIFSQMSGFGITNYGVKKMLPRLIVAAILVNTSYFICQIAIDISNIIGYSLDNMLKNFATSAIGSSGAVEDGSYFSSKVATVLGFTGTLALAALSITIPMIIAAVAALIMIVFLLVSRQAVVILLVVVAPIAFVAYLLPNTNSLFKQWKKIFLAMLMLFPIIALVFGASSMAATILNEAFNDSNNTTIGPVIVAAINVLPLFAVPIILKKSLNSVGNIGATINGLGAKLSGAATQQYQKSNAGQFMKYRQSQIEQNRTNAQAGIYKGRNPYRSAVSAINRGANTALKTGFGGKLLKNFAMSAESRGKSILDKEFEEQVSIAAASQKNMSYDSIKAIATGANAATEAERTAAIRVGLQKGAYSERKEIYKSIKTNDTDRIKTSATDGFFAQKDQQFFGAGMAGDIATGGIDEAKLIQNMAKSASKFSAETLVEDANASADIYKALQLNGGDIQEIFKSDNAEKTQQNIASYYKAASDLPQIAKNIPSSTVLQSKLNGEKSANIAKIAGLGVSSTTVDKS